MVWGKIKGISYSQAALNLDSKSPKGILFETKFIGLSPNPLLRGQSKIRLQLSPGIHNLDITLYDISGKRVSTVFSGQKKAGYHTFYLTRGNHSNGIYLLRIMVDNKILATKRLAILNKEN
jgi:hypothetical protein